MRQRGFTIVELLIVIVVIGILAAITIVAYNGIQSRAQVSALTQELTDNAHLVMAAGASSSTGQLSTLDVMSGGAAANKMNTSNYKLISYCTNGTDFAYAVLTNAGKAYYVKNGTAVINNDSMNVFDPCSTAGIASSIKTYTNLPAMCSTQGANCTFSGTVTIAYCSAAIASCSYQLNQTSPVACNDSLGDPAFGYSKACYVYPN
jgi:prepilin-type N-terminal cleavage/methylation domain-containing protein